MNLRVGETLRIFGAFRKHLVRNISAVVKRDLSRTVVVSRICIIGEKSWRLYCFISALSNVLVNDTYFRLNDA